MLAFHMPCEGSRRREDWGAHRAVGSGNPPLGRFGLASDLGLEPWQCFPDNGSRSEVGGDELLDFMTQ